MLRFILERKRSDRNSGLYSTVLETVDIDYPVLEKLLNRGGSDQSGYDHTSLVGVEVRS